jgi:hypothetical protein
VGQFAKAEVRDRVGDAGWDFAVPVIGQSVIARVQVGNNFDVVRVSYSDETQPRTLYKNRDYSNPHELRVAGAIFYVYWSEALMRTNHWMLAYDFEKRAVVTRRRIDPKDLPSKISEPVRAKSQLVIAPQ